MSDDSAVCSSCGNPQFACDCEFQPEYLPADGQERCPNCHGPQDRCVCAPASGADLALTVQPTDIGASAIVVEGAVLAEIDQDVLTKLVEHEFSTTCTPAATGVLTIEHVQREAVADYFRQFGYSIVDSTAHGTDADTTASTSDTALYTTESATENHSSSPDAAPEEPTESGVDQSTATYGPLRCAACERSFPDRNDLPKFCPACGTEL